MIIFFRSLYTQLCEPCAYEMIFEVKLVNIASSQQSEVAGLEDLANMYTLLFVCRDGNEDDSIIVTTFTKVD